MAANPHCESGRPQVLDPAMEQAAREFCAVIEAAEQLGRDVVVVRVSALLPRLHAVMSVATDPFSPRACIAGFPDYERRFDLYSRLRRLFGAQDGYWLEFDDPQQPQTGSLADDLTDIYFDLCRGLDLLPDRPQQAWEAWRCTFDLHWGQHLVDAERHLFQMKATRAGA